jgi:indole-3-acetate monooxygenase
VRADLRRSLLGVGGRPRDGRADFAYHAGGGSSLYAGNTPQRRMRDIHAITQHFLITPDTLTTVGAVLAGQDVDLPVF